MLSNFRQAGRHAVSAAILGLLFGCASAPPGETPPARVDGKAPAPSSPIEAAASPRPKPNSFAVLFRPKARWVAADWLDLPGWYDDHSSELWPALLRGCERAPPEWLKVCSDARMAPPVLSDANLRAWLQQRLQPYRVEPLADGGPEGGLITGYYEPLIEASRVPRGIYRVPLYRLPADLAARKPYWTRQQLDTLPAARASLKGRELAYVADPLDALILQIQGSGRINLTEVNGSRKLLRVAYAGHNDQPYKSVGKWLVEQGEIPLDQASWPGIKAWAKQNPKRINELLWANPRYVFFREEALPDPELGPRGSMGVALTPGRSIAVDPQSVPYGTPVWLDTTEPLSNTPLRRIVMAQDTGSAISGAVRADYFWGWGENAEQQAGRMKQALRMWVLWPR
jgi:membrane-bound lytic murein transglycosylase A